MEIQASRACLLDVQVVAIWNEDRGERKKEAPANIKERKCYMFLLTRLFMARLINLRSGFADAFFLVYAHVMRIFFFIS